MEDKITAILKAKQSGTDCTELESAEIKGFLRENWFVRKPLFWQVVDAFPLEANEVLNETDSPTK